MSKKNSKRFLYSYGIQILTRVNGCENHFCTTVTTNNSIKNKKVRKKVFEYLMSEYGVEGMYGFKEYSEWTSTVEDMKKYHYFFENCTVII